MSGEAPNEHQSPSQDEIDAALEAAGQTDAASDAPPSDNPSGTSDPTAGGQTGPDPTGAAAESPPTSPSGAPDEPSPGPQPQSELSQADIDAAIGAASQPQAEPAPAPAEGDNAETKDSAEDAEKTGSSQGDIDVALAEAAGDAEDAADADQTGAAPQAKPLTTDADGAPKLDSAGRPFDEAAAMMEAAIAEERAAAAAPAEAPPPEAAPEPAVPMPPPPEGAVSLEMPAFDASSVDDTGDKGIGLLNDVELDIKIELGRAQMWIEDVLKLGEGSVIELDKLAGDPVDILVNDKLVARGEVLVLNDSFCVRISEIVAGLGMEVGT
jgi:flagellar motor switch protein FliN/FliY